MGEPITDDLTVNGEKQEHLKRVISRIFDLPSFPLVIKKLSEVAENPNSNSEDLAKVMISDQGLSAKVLKLVNSSFYSFSKPVASLQHAITLLGFNTIKSLAMSVSVKNIFSESKGEFSQDNFWEHSLAVALATRLFAERNRSPLKDDAFTSGLMHDVGILLEARYFPEELNLAIVASREDDDLSFIQAEEQFVGIDHSLLGAWLAQQWRLPPMLSVPMRFHHKFMIGTCEETDELAEEERSILAFVVLANIVVNGMGLCHGTRPEDDGEEPKITIPKHLHPFVGDGPLGDIIPKIEELLQDSREFLAM